MKSVAKFCFGFALVASATFASAQSDVELNRLLSHIREDKTAATIDALRKMRPGVISRLIQKAKTGPRSARLDAINALGCVGSHEQYSLLMDLIVDQDEAVHEEASDAVNFILVREFGEVYGRQLMRGASPSDPFSEEEDRALDEAFGGPEGSKLRSEVGLKALRIPVLNYIARPTAKSGEALLERLMQYGREDKALDSKALTATSELSVCTFGDEGIGCAFDLIWSESPATFTERLGDRTYKFRSELIWRIPAELRKKYGSIIIDATTDSVDSVRQAACFRIRGLDKTVALPLLLNLLPDPIPDIRMAALLSMSALDAPFALEQALNQRKAPLMHSGVVSFVARADGNECLPQLVECLKSSDREIAQSACEAIAHTKTERSLTALLSIVQNGPADLKGQAVGFLGLYGSDKVLPVLLPLLNDKDRFVVRNACLAMEQLGDATPLPELRKLSHSKDPYIVTAAKDAIKAITAKSEPPPMTH